jgi:hypothetical protein
MLCERVENMVRVWEGAPFSDALGGFDILQTLRFYLLLVRFDGQVPESVLMGALHEIDSKTVLSTAAAFGVLLTTPHPFEVCTFIYLFIDLFIYDYIFPLFLNL